PVHVGKGEEPGGGRALEGLRCSLRVETILSLMDKRVPICNDDFRQLLNACHELPPATNDYRVDDFIDNLMLTVLDFNRNTVEVERAMAHYKHTCRGELRSIQDLELLL